MSAQKTFAQLIKSFFRPNTVQFDIGPLKLTYSEQLRVSLALVSAQLRGQNVFFADVNNEVWYLVFKALRSAREALIRAEAAVMVPGPQDLKNTLRFMQDLVSSYINEYEGQYGGFMSSRGCEYPNAPNAWASKWAHAEREWPLLGAASRDLLLLRASIAAGIKAMNAFIDSGSVIEWKEPDIDYAEHWSAYAARRAP